MYIHAVWFGGPLDGEMVNVDVGQSFVRVPVKELFPQPDSGKPPTPLGYFECPIEKAWRQVKDTGIYASYYIIHWGRRTQRL